MAINPPSSSPPHSTPSKALNAQRESQLSALKVEAKIRIQGTVDALVKQISPISSHQRQVLFATKQVAGNSDKSAVKNTVKNSLSDSGEKSISKANTGQGTTKPQLNNSTPAKSNAPPLAENSKTQIQNNKALATASRLYLAEIELKNIRQLVVTNKALVAGEKISVKVSSNNQLQIVDNAIKNAPANTLTKPLENTFKKNAAAETNPSQKAPAEKALPQKALFQKALTGKTVPTQNQTQIQAHPQSKPHTPITQALKQNQIALVLNSLREALPKQSPSSKLIEHSMKLNSLPASALNKIFTAQQKSVINGISNIAQTPEQLKNPQTLKQALNNSGLFFESKLAKNINKNSTPTENVSKSLKINSKNTKAEIPRDITLSARKNELESSTSTRSKENMPANKLATANVKPNRVNSDPEPKKNLQFELRERPIRNSSEKTTSHLQRAMGSIRDRAPTETKIASSTNKDSAIRASQTTTPPKTSLNNLEATNKTRVHVDSTIKDPKTLVARNTGGKPIVPTAILNKNISNDPTPNMNGVGKSPPKNNLTEGDKVATNNIIQDQKGIYLIAKELLSNFLHEQGGNFEKSINHQAEKNSSSLDKLLKPFLQSALRTEGDTKESANNKSSQELQQQLLAQLRSNINSTLARLQVLQAQSLMTKTPTAEPSQTNTPQLQTEIPVQYQNGIHQVGVEIEEEWIQKEGADSDDEESRSKRWSVMLNFSLPEKGEFYAKLRVVEETVSVQFWADKTETLKLAEQGITPLYEELSAQGINVEEIQCVSGRPPTKKIKLEYSLVDLRT